MHRFIFIGFFEIDPYFFLRFMYVFLALFVLLFVFIITYTFYKRNAERHKKTWQQNITDLISAVIFLNEGEKLPESAIAVIRKQLCKQWFRQDIIDELIHAKKNLSGSFTLNLVTLYESLELNNDSFKKLHNKKWHIQAKGLQELALMGQVKYVKQIFRLTNNANDFVRNEAQSALVSFYGFTGLRFLNVTTHPICEWQQILFLNNLNRTKPEDLRIIGKWLQSSNESVVIFALKLATYFNCHEFYPAVVHCLEHRNLQARLNVLEYLKKMPGENVPELLVRYYTSADKTLKLLILDILKDNGSEKELNFLLKLLYDDDDGIKIAAARTISSLHPTGAAFLQSHLFAGEYPWKTIFLQILSERAA